MPDRTSRRLFVLRALVLSMLLTLLGRLAYLQVVEGAHYAKAAQENRVRDVVTPAARGEVVDVTGAPLVRNRTALVVSVDRAQLIREPHGGTAVLGRLGAVLGRPAADLARAVTPCGAKVPAPCWRGSPYQPVPVAEVAADDAAGLRAVLAVQEHREDFPAVQVDFRAVRDYPSADRTTASHVLGYLGPISSAEVRTAPYAGVRPDALVGRSGVEETYDAALRGTDGVEHLEVDSSGAVTGRREQTPSVPGSTLVLSLDAAVQSVAEHALRAALEHARTLPASTGGTLHADSGAVVVMEAKTGRLVALASAPSFDPTVFVGGASPAQYAALVDDGRGAPLLSRPVSGAYAPASTFKVVSTAAAVQSGDYPLTGRYPCPGAFAPLGGKRNFESEALGTIDLHTALEQSCDTVFYKFAYEQWLRDGGTHPVAHPRDPILTMASAFGLGAATGVDLPGERRGAVPDRAYLQQRWQSTKAARCAAADDGSHSEEQRRADREFCADGGTLRGGDAANDAVGQGDLLVTPLQLATVYAAVANGGTLLSPRVARAIVSADGKQVTDVAPTVRGHVPVDPAVLAYERDALLAVTHGGTATSAFAGLPLAVAGKTGTGEVAGRQDTSWFASFAPAEDPQLVVVAMVSQGGTGATTAAPMVRDVYAGIYGLDGRAPALPGGRLPDQLPASVRAPAADR